MLIHVINSPESERIDPNEPSDPPAAKYVEVEMEFDGDRSSLEVWALQRYDYEAVSREPVQKKLTPEFDGSTMIVELPPFKYHTLLVIRRGK
jgi:hypothetical protein